jgi:flavin reductase (DIM6/NTAB) family NADH-FMN oxidoreductase RutF
MKIDPQALSRRDAYWLMISSIVPRPIAWVSTVSADGLANLAPFSYFMGVASDPPTLAIAIGRRAGALKDTARNIRETGEFVVNVVNQPLAEVMVRTSADVAPEVDEFEACGLTKLAADHVRPPRVAESPVAMECRLTHLLEVGAGRTQLVIGEVVCFHVDDALWSGRHVDVERLAPLGRLGGALYAPITVTREMQRPAVDPATGQILDRNG